MKIFDNLYITKITHAIKVDYDVKTDRKITNRQWFGLCFATKGQITYYHNGKEIVCDKNHAVLMPKDATYTFTATKDSSFNLINFLVVDKGCFSEFVAIPIKNADNYDNIFDLLQETYLLKELNGCTNFMQIFYQMLSQLNNENVVVQSSYLKKSLEYINDNFSNPGISNNMLANQLNISVSHFRNLFKESYGISPIRYIQELRISKAKQLLTNTRLSVTDISERCGYTNIYSFSRCFKNKVGISPAEYAKQKSKFNI